MTSAKALARSCVVMLASTDLTNAVHGCYLSRRDVIAPAMLLHVKRCSASRVIAASCNGMIQSAYKPDLA